MRQLLEELFALYYQDVYRYLYSLCRDPSLAQDLASETFLEAVRSIGSFQGRADVKTWLFSIARHRWFAYLRKKRSEPSFMLELLLESEKTPEDTILLRQAIQRVRDILESEPERTRRMVELRMEGFSYHEIARALNISENSARVIHFRIREKLRKILKEEGYYDA